MLFGRWYDWADFLLELFIWVGMIGMASWLVVIFVMMFIASKPKITEGEIYQKNHQPEEKTFTILPMNIMNGKTITTIMVPYWITYPESWSIDIREWDKEEEEYITQRFYIEEDVYERVTVGEMFKVSSNDSTERPEIREKADN